MVSITPPPIPPEEFRDVVAGLKSIGVEVRCIGDRYRLYAGRNGAWVSSIPAADANPVDLRVKGHELSGRYSKAMDLQEFLTSSRKLSW
jgi:hypothetical protein